MAIQLGTVSRNARIDGLVAAVGASPLLEIFTGSMPATPATADSGTKLASAAGPASWMNAASGGAATKTATAWTDSSADATGTAGYFRLKNSGGSVVHMQGTVSLSGGGGDMILDSLSFTAGQTFTVQTFTLTDGNV